MPFFSKINQEANPSARFHSGRTQPSTGLLAPQNVDKVELGLRALSQKKSAEACAYFDAAIVENAARGTEVYERCVMAEVGNHSKKPVSSYYYLFPMADRSNRADEKENAYESVLKRNPKLRSIAKTHREAQAAFSLAPPPYEEYALQKKKAQ